MAKAKEQITAADPVSLTDPTSVEPSGTAGNDTDLKWFVVREGRAFGSAREHKEGTLLQLTASAAIAFPDILKLLPEEAEAQEPKLA